MLYEKESLMGSSNLGPIHTMHFIQRTTAYEKSLNRTGAWRVLCPLAYKLRNMSVVMMKPKPFLYREILAILLKL